MIQRKAFIKRTPLKKRPHRPRPEGFEDAAFLDWLRTWPCYVCLRKYCAARAIMFYSVIDSPAWREECRNSMGMYACGPTEAAHIGVRGLAQKSRDREAMPLGRKHHEHATAGGGPESHHSMGRKFWSHHDLDAQTVIAILNQLYKQETGK